jgi:pimeloyl-ACP methyl ester carboxylesterase
MGFPMSPSPKSERFVEILRILQGPLNVALDSKRFWNLLEEEAQDPSKESIVTPEFVESLREVDEQRREKPRLALFNSTDDVIIIPGFMGSELRDVYGDLGLIWIDPKLVFNTAELSSLKLKPYKKDEIDIDADPNVLIQPNGAIPLLYVPLKTDLEIRRYDVMTFGFDWRKNVDESAILLADLIRQRLSRPPKPLHIIAHSQGALVARRAIQFLGSDDAHKLVNRLVLLGPATGGTFAAAFAIAGNHGLLESLRKWGIHPPDGFKEVLQSMSGLYQLLPWQTDNLSWLGEAENDLRNPEFWKSEVDEHRLKEYYAWGKGVDTRFFNDRTAIILGGAPTVGGVKFQNGILVEDPDYAVSGDGTVPDSLARLEGVSTYKAEGVEHMNLAASRTAIRAVRDLLAGRLPGVSTSIGVRTGDPGIRILVPAQPRKPKPKTKTKTATAFIEKSSGPVILPSITPPSCRRLKVFSFDPLLGTDLDSLGVDQITIELPWEWTDGDRLQMGPVGEYLEVIDYDPANQCFYPPVDLNHPYVLAQDGVPVSESDPRFHQQMVFAVCMNTIRQFEIALGRVALWAPHLERDERGNVKWDQPIESQFVRRLRVYPHGLQEANAYYHPDRVALLFGYFPANQADVGRNLPGGTVFSCLSYDVVAHETTHALLDGLHRYFTQPSNPDVFSFHEAFADCMAIFQHFTHVDVLQHQVAKTRGELSKQNLLGELASQFGEATGRRGALRQYLGSYDEKKQWVPLKPEHQKIKTTFEPHARGAILVAALFRAFLNIYENRVADLRRIATGGSGILPQGEMHPDLVTRLAIEASRSAQHLLRMCVRALDYVPPVDITFGEFLRALITADYDLVHDDDRGYRVSVLSAFRDWGIYPSDVTSLSVDSLLWLPPETEAMESLNKVLSTMNMPIRSEKNTSPTILLLEMMKENGLFDWNLHADRFQVFQQMRINGALLHDWLEKILPLWEGGKWLGLAMGKDAPRSVLLPSKKGNPKPKIEVHSIRPCRRIGPDGQQLTDVLIEITQRRKAFLDLDVQKELDDPKSKVALDDPKFAQPDFYFRGGCSLVIDADRGDIRYCIRKSVANDKRLERERKFRLGDYSDFQGGRYLTPLAGDHNPFAFLHGGI